MSKQLSLASRYRQLATEAKDLLAYTVRRLMWTANGKLRNRVIVKTDQGRFSVYCKDFNIGKQLYCRRQFEGELMQQICRQFAPAGGSDGRSKRTMLDIGANLGITGIGMMNLGLVDSVIAIEPDPMNFTLLNENVRLNGLTEKYVCLQVAASDKPGTLEFELSEDNFGDHRVRLSGVAAGQELLNESGRNVIRVPAQTLDSLVAACPAELISNLTLLWIDVQGYEAYAFEGARELLKRGIPVVSELWPYGMRRAGVTADRFCAMSESIWTRYWVERNGKFISYPITLLRSLFEELGDTGDYTNVVFTS